MMNLAVMRQLVAEAEEGAKDMPTAHAALAHWCSDAGTLRDIRYSANAIYFFTQQEVVRVLRLVHAGDGIQRRTKAHIEAELDFIRYLNTQGISAMEALPTQTGTYVETVKSPYAHFYASVFEKAGGDLRLDVETLNDAQITAWGKITAQIHKASETYIPPANCRRPNWHEILGMIKAWLPAQEQDAQRFLSEAEAWLASLSTGPDDYGLIHWDLCIDNLAWDEVDSVGHYHIFDFDDAAYFWYAADLAFALDDVLAWPAARREAFMARFLDAYCAIRPAIMPWIDHIPRFVKFMHIAKAARVMNALAPADPALDPPWLAGLRAKFENWFVEMRQAFAEPF